jgi:sodium-coupled neutral amino acid transporter 9
MMLSFFLHNVVQPLIKNADPATRRVDIALGYTVAGLLYAVVGVLGYVGFADAFRAGACAHAPAPAPPRSNCTLSSDFIANFGSSLATSADAYTFSARLSLLLQLFTVFPILLLIIRGQVFKLFSGTDWPGAGAVAALNAAVMLITTAFAALDLQIGVVLRYVGAVGGLVIVFAVPVGMEAVALLEEQGVVEKGGRVGCAQLRALRARDAARLGAVLGVGAVFFVLQFIPGV